MSKIIPSHECQKRLDELAIILKDYSFQKELNEIFLDFYSIGKLEGIQLGFEESRKCLLDLKKEMRNL